MFGFCIRRPFLSPPWPSRMVSYVCPHPMFLPHSCRCSGCGSQKGQLPAFKEFDDWYSIDNRYVYSSMDPPHVHAETQPCHYSQVRPFDTPVRSTIMVTEEARFQTFTQGPIEDLQNLALEAHVHEVLQLSKERTLDFKSSGAYLLTLSIHIIIYS